MAKSFQVGVFPVEWREYKYVVRFPDEKGRRRKKFFKQKRLAERFANDKRAEMGQRRVSVKSLSPSVQGALEELSLALEDSSLTLEQVLIDAAKRVRQQARSESVNHVIDRVMETKISEGASDRHVHSLSSTFRRFGEAFDGRVISEISADDISAWLVAQKVKPVTVRTLRAHLSILFNFARLNRWVSESPIDRAWNPKVRATNVEIYRAEELSRWVKSINDPQILAVVCIGAFAGVRPSEVERLVWDDVDFERDVICVDPRKGASARRRFVPIHSTLKKWLVCVRGAGRLFPFFENSSNLFYGRKLVAQSREAAGVRGIPDGLRHSFASHYLPLLEGNRAKLADIMGNSVEVINRHYREPLLPSEVEAYWKILP